MLMGQGHGHCTARPCHLRKNISQAAGLLRARDGSYRDRSWTRNNAWRLCSGSEGGAGTAASSHTTEGPLFSASCPSVHLYFTTVPQPVQWRVRHPCPCLTGRDHVWDSPDLTECLTSVTLPS